MTADQLFSEIKRKKSYLCVGLDTDLQKIPAFLHQTEDPVFEFNRAIIEATKDLCIAYKINIAFYESMGIKGWQSLEKTLAVIPEDIFTIADAKRGDIGNTSKMYAKTFFETFNFDSVTVAPYMGEDSVTPFLEYEDKWVIILALTSNNGSRDFQFMQENGEHLFERVIKKANHWGSPENVMFVVGATHPEMFSEIRKIAPDNFFLVPGIGAQGGNLEKVSHYGQNNKCGLLINSSRGIIYAGNDTSYADHARTAALKIQSEMEHSIKIHVN